MYPIDCAKMTGMMAISCLKTLSVSSTSGTALYSRLASAGFKLLFIRHLNHDPDVYGADADDFRPGRHIDANGKLKPATPETKDESHVTYGFGRRCIFFS